MAERYGWEVLKGMTLRRFFALIDVSYLKGKEIEQEQRKEKSKQSAEAKRKEMVNNIKRARGVKK